MANKTLDELIEQVNKRKEEKRTAEKELKKTFKETAVDSKGSKKSESTPKVKTDTEKKSFADTIANRAAEARDENTKKKLSEVGVDPGLVDRYNQRMAENEAEKKAGSGKNYGSFTSILRDKKAQEMLDQLDVRKSSEGSVTRAHSSALDKARKSKLPNSSSAADFVQSRSERMGELAIGDGRVNEDLKLEKELADAKRKIQWQEAQKRYDALSDEEKQALYRRHNSSALDRARMSAEENPALQGGGTVYDTRTAIGQNIADRYYNLEEKVTDPNAAGGYAFLNRMRSAAGTTAENLGNWAYDTLGWEPGKEAYERGEARKIGEIASQQLQNELAMHPTQTGQDFVKAADSIANMVSYKIASAPISLFASAVAGDLATNAALKKGSDAIGKAAQAGETVDANKIIAQAVEEGLKKSHDVSGSIFTSSMALGSFGDKYIESRAEGQGKLESSVRAVTAAVISYATESLGGIGGSKSPLNKLEDAAKKKWVTNVIYNAFEEGGEEFAEYALNYIANGIIDLVAQGKWSQEWNNAEVWENMRVAGISGGMFGAASGGINVFSGNAKVDAQLDSAGKEFLNYLDAVYKAEQDPAVRAAVEAQIDGMFDDAGIGVLANRYKAAEQSEAEQGKADTETEMLDQLDTAKEAERAAAREAETIRKTIESVKNSDLTADEKLARIKNLYNGSENAEARRALKAAFVEIQSEAKAEQTHAQNTEQVQPPVKPEVIEQTKPETVEQVQPTQETAGQTLQTNEETNAPAKQTPEKAAQSGTRRKADSETLRRAYAEYSKDNPSAMDKKKFDKLYNEAYNAESFDDVLSKHKKLGDSLKKVLQKAFDNGHRAETKAAKNAMLDSGLVMNDGDEYMLNNRGDIDTLIDRYERAIEDGYVPIETAGENQDRESLADQYRELSDSDIENYRNAIEKLKKYKDEHFPKAKQGVSTGNKGLSTEQKNLSTEQKNLSTDNKGLSTETSTSKETKRLESVIKNLTELKRNLENGNMEKLEHQNPEKYNSLMYKLEQRTADKNGSDYFGSAEDVQVLIDKYKADLDVLKAENGAQKAQFDSGKKAVYNESNQYATVAPYYNTEVTAENKQQVKEAVDSAFRKKAEETAKSIGIKLKGDASNMGGFTFSEGEAAGQQVHEISYSFEFEDATPEQVQLFASLMAENGYEQQEAVIQKRYVANIDEGNAYEYTIRYRNLNSFEAAKALERAGITDYTIDETNSVVQVLEFDTQNNTEVFELIKNLIANEGEENFYGTDFKPVQSEYLDEKARSGLYRSWLDTELRDGQLRDYISESLRKVEERIRENERAAERREVKTETNTEKADAESTGSFNAQNTDEYSPEYQNGAEHPGTVGGMESDRSNITRAANESGTLPAKKNPFSDFDKYKADLDVLKAENGAQNTAPAENNDAQEIENGAQNEKAAEKAAENKEPKVQSYEDFKKNPPADGEKSPIKVSPYTVIKSPYEGESPNNKADAKSERVEVSAESFAEGKSVYEIRTNGAGQTGVVAKVKKALTDILNSIGGQHSVTANNIEFGGKPYEVAVNMSIAGKLAGDPNASAEKFAVLKNIDGIIENAEYVGSSDYIQHGAKNKNVTRYDYFETKATIDGKPYVVAFDVEVIPGKNNYRTHKVLNEINLTPVPSGEPSPRLGAQGKKSGLQGDVPSPKTNIPQNGNNVKPGNEYSSEYQNGAEHPGTVGGMESDRRNITRAANESGVLPAKKNPFSDFDKYKADENVPSGEKAALARTINDPMLGEITVAQNVTNMAKDGAKFVAQDGFFYAQYEDGTSVKVSKSVYNFGKFLNEQGVHYTLNQNAEMPQKMGKKYVSKAVTSFIASRGGTDAVVEAIQAKIEADEAGYTYERKGHEKITRAAGEKIVEMGFDGAVEFFRERAQGDYKYTSELNALGIMLSNIAAESNTKEGTNLAATIMGWVAANQTNAGQVTESMKLVRKLVENNSEIYYQSLVDSLQEKYKKELEGENITLDMELLKKVSETAGTKENAKWADKLNISIANQIPATSLEKLNAFRYFCMLSSGRTHAKNIISNAAMFTMVVQKNLWLSVFERMYKAKNPDYMLTTSGLKTSADSQRFAREIFDVLKSDMDSGGNKYTPGDFVRQYRTNTMQGNGKYAKYNLPGWVLDRFANATTGLLSAEDMVAKKALFVNRFAQIMEANGWTSEFLSDNTDPKAIRAYENAADIAIEEAMKGTFNDKNPWTNVINAWRKMETIDFHDRSSKAAVGTLIEIMLPFKNVPLNIAKAAIQYSPIGIVNGVVDLNRGAKNGTLEPRIALENIAKGATGTTVSIGGLMLAMMGFLTLGKGKDEDKPIAEKEDTTMYLKFPDEEKGDVYIEVDWIDSIAMQLRFGLELKDIFDEASENKKNGDGISLVEDFVSSVLASAGRTFDTYMDIGMMSSVQNTLLNKSGADSMTDFFTDKGVNLGTQFIPRLLTDIRQAFDKEKRNTYYVADVDNDSKWLHLMLNQLTAAYGDRSKLPARLDEWGNSLGEENDAKRIIESMISPSKWYREDKDEVEEMLDQLDTKVDTNVFPGDYPKQITVNGEKIKLSGKEYEEVARQIGKERYKLLDELRKDKSFQKLSADEKADIIQKCYTIANEMAKAGFDDNYAISTVTRNVQDAEKAKIPISTYLTIAQAYSNMAEYEKNGVTVSTSEQLAEYLIKDKSTTAEEDIKLFELLTRKKKDGSYSSPLDNIKKVPKADAEEQLKLYQITKIKDKEEAIQTYMLEGYNSAEALARYNVAKGAKTKYSGLGTNQKKKTDKLLAASKSGKTECKWTEEKLTLAACAVTSIGDYGTLKTQKYYVQMLMAVGFTEKEAKEFYKYYA